MGYTHKDIDHSVSSTTCRLFVPDVVTRSNLHRELCSSYQSMTSASMSNEANISGLYDSSKPYRCNMILFCHFRCFHFIRREYDITGCIVSVNCSTDWPSLHHEKLRFLSHMPSLSTTPSTLVRRPDGSSHVTKRILSEAYRVNRTKKMAALSFCGGQLLRTRREWFRRNTDYVQLITIQTTSQDGSRHDDLIERERSEIIWENFSYGIRTYVAVLCEGIVCPFRFVLVSFTKMKSTGVFCSLGLHWL